VSFTPLRSDWCPLSMSDNAGSSAALVSGRPRKNGTYGELGRFCSRTVRPRLGGLPGTTAWVEDGQRMQQCWHEAELQVIFIRTGHVQFDTQRPNGNANVRVGNNSQRWHWYVELTSSKCHLEWPISRLAERQISWKEIRNDLVLPSRAITLHWNFEWNHIRLRRGDTFIITIITTWADLGCFYAANAPRWFIICWRRSWTGEPAGKAGRPKVLARVWHVCTNVRRLSLNLQSNK